MLGLFPIGPAYLSGLPITALHGAAVCVAWPVRTWVVKGRGVSVDSAAAWEVQFTTSFSFEHDC